MLVPTSESMMKKLLQRLLAPIAALAYEAFFRATTSLDGGVLSFFLGDGGGWMRVYWLEGFERSEQL